MLKEGVNAAARAPGRNELTTAVARFQAPILTRSLGQLAISVGGFAGVCAIMYATLSVSYWLTLGLSVLAAGLLVRIFIIQHDCGHGSFLRSRRANDVVGVLCSMLTLTPYAAWRRQHAGHHRVWNDLDRRQSGADIYSACLTVAEYQGLTAWGRRWYRWTRHPVVSNVLLPPLIFVVLYRLPFDTPRAWKPERRAVHATNLGLAALIAVLGLLVGFERAMLVQLPIMIVASIVGVWLFTVQHRFERSLWARHGEWTFTTAALAGASYLRLPPILRWFTGNIGFHHVHHLNPRVPNYRLSECHDSIAGLSDVPMLTLRTALRAPLFALWDEDRHTMVTFRAASRVA